MLQWHQYKEINNLTSRGKIPTFFRALENKIITDNTNSRTTVYNSQLTTNIINTPVLKRTPPSTDNRKKEWIVDIDHTNIGKITSKRSIQGLTYEHWVYDDIDRNTITPCKGCNASSRYNANSSQNNRCFKRGLRRDFSVIKTKDHHDSSIEKRKIISTPIGSLEPNNLIRLELPHLFDEETPLSAHIFIDDFDNSLINKWTSSDTLQRHLKFCLQAIRERIVNIYTDGSLNPKELNMSGLSIMGAGWILEDSEISFHCATCMFPSSTRAEILAILTAILATPSNTALNIYTDSQAAIDGIHNVIRNPLSAISERFKQCNFVLLNIIKDLITSKGLMFTMHKVKGHSQNLWNDAADQLANHGRREALLDISRLFLISDNIDISGFSFFPKWNGFLLDCNIRKFYSLFSHSFIESNWSFNSFWDLIFDFDHITNFQKSQS